MKPNEVRPEHTKILLDRLYFTKKYQNTINREKYRKRLLKVGNRVRITKQRKTFDKEADQKWTEEIFVIRKVLRRGFPITYLISDLRGEDIEGSFYVEELQLI